MIEVIIDDKKLKAAFTDLATRAANPAPALKAIGEDLIESTKQRFSSATSPDGTKWQFNSKVTVERKGRNKPLIDGGTLQKTINYQLIGNDTLAIGSPMQYAAMQNFGGQKSEFPHLWGDIPARQFLGISETDEAQILDTIGNYLTT